MGLIAKVGVMRVGFWARPSTGQCHTSMHCSDSESSLHYRVQYNGSCIQGKV